MRQVIKVEMSFFNSLSNVSMQIYSARDLEDNLNKIREICSDDKHEWDQRAAAVSIFNLIFSLFK